MTTITIDRAVVQQALEALENESRSPRGYGYELSVYEMRETSAAIDSLRAALAQEQEPEPIKHWHNTVTPGMGSNDRGNTPAPPPCPTCQSLARTVMMDQMGKA